MDKDIAIIGISGIFPKAKNLQTFHKNLYEGKDCISNVSDSRKKLLGFDENLDYMRLGFIDDIEYFDNTFFNIANKEADNMSPEQRLSLELVAETILDAGYSLEKFRGMNCAVIASCTDNEYEGLLKEKTGLSYIGSLKSMLSGKIAYYFDLHGPNIVIDTGCSSTLVCIHEACMKLAYKEVDYSIAGGITVWLSLPEDGNDGENDILNISSKDGRCKSFDWRADGTGLGEGGGYLLLKRLGEALRDQDHIYGVIRGSAINGDGIRCSSVTTPSIEGQKEAIIRAWENGKINTEGITEIEAHGTGTKLGDPIEVTSITESFRHFNTKRSKVQLGSVKSSVGHLGFAAGVASVIKVLLGFQYHSIYPLVNFEKPNALINFENSLLEPTKCLQNTDSTTKRIAGINSFGFSGTNAHVVIENYIKTVNTEEELQNNNRLVKISAKSETAFYNYLETLKLYLERNKVNINDAIYTLNIGRDDYKYRRMLYIKDMEDFIEQLDMIAPIKDTKQAKIVFILTNNEEESLDCNILCKHYLPFKQHLSQTLDNNTIGYKIAMYQFLYDLGIKPDILIADEFGKDVVKYIKGNISQEEIIDKTGNPLKNSNTENIVKQIDKLSENNPLFIINMGSELLELKREYTYPVKVFRPNTVKVLEKLFIAFYNSGFHFNWEKYYENNNKNRISLPTYCFDKTKHWQEMKPQGSHLKQQNIGEIKNQDPKQQKVNQQEANQQEVNQQETNKKFDNRLPEDIEEILKDLWKNVLDYDEDINREEDFFDLGGNSLLISMLTEEVKEVLNVKIDVAEVYDYSSIGQQAELIHSRLYPEGSGNVVESDKVEESCNGVECGNMAEQVNVAYEEAAITHNDLEKTFLLTSMQKTIVYSQEKYPERGTWNLSLALRIDGSLDCNKMKEAMQQLVNKHELLRSIVVKDQEEPRMKLCEGKEIQFRVVMTEDLDTLEGKETLIRKMLREEALKPMKLYDELLMSTSIYVVSETVHYMLINIHHLIADGWSLSILFHQLCQYYTNSDLQLEAIVPFREFAAYEEENHTKSQVKKQLDYWREEMRGFQYQMELPVKKEKIESSVINVSFMLIDFDTTKKLKEYAKLKKTSIFHVILLTYHLTLMKLFHVKDSCIGMMVGNRNNKKFNNTIGLLARVLPSRICIDDNENIDVLLNKVKVKSANALDNQQCSVNEILGAVIGEEKAAFDDLIKFLIVYQNFGNIDLKIDDLKFSTGILNERSALCPLALITYESNQAVVSSIEYDPSYFNKQDINGFMQSYQEILKGIVEDKTKEVTVKNPL